MAAKDNKDKEAALPEGQAEKPKKKSRLKKIIILLAILLFTAGAGIGAYWWLYIRTPGHELAEAPTQEQPSDSAPATRASGANEQNQLNSARIERQSDLPRAGSMVLPLPPITVNLAGDSGRRYLKLGLEVEVNSDVSRQLKEQQARVRDSIIMLMAGKTYGDVASPDGKILLKADIAARLNQILGGQYITRVYFTDFVVE